MRIALAIRIIFLEKIMAKILVIDDSRTIREMLIFSLKAQHTVDEAENGQIGIDMFKRQTYDLVITDLNMPNIDGLTVIREYRKLPQYRSKPILMLTTEADATKKQQGKEAGATGWMVKPFDPAKLIATIAKVLG